jgi:hypothetical protein
MAEGGGAEGGGGQILINDKLFLEFPQQSQEIAKNMS